MSGSATSSRLPRQVDPRKLAQQGVELNGEVPLAEMDRLAAMALPDSQVARSAMAHLAFGIDEANRRVIRGSVHCRIPLSCQRCLEQVEVELNTDLALAVVWSEEQAQSLPGTLDPLIHAEGAIDLFTVVEDELLLSLPMVALHDEECIDKTSFGEAGSTGPEASATNPFQVLQQLKDSSKS